MLGKAEKNSDIDILVEAEKKGIPYRLYKAEKYFRKSGKKKSRLSRI